MKRLYSSHSYIWQPSSKSEIWGGRLSTQKALTIPKPTPGDQCQRIRISWREWLLLMLTRSRDTEGHMRTASSKDLQLVDLGNLSCSTTVCSTPDPSVTPAVDHHKQHETAKGNGTKKGDNPHGMPGWSIGLIVLVIFVVLVLIGTLVCCFFKHKFPETWNKICCPWLVYTAEERPQNEQEMDPLNNASAEIINIPENEDTNTPVAPARE
ncbi:uncharacterized protein LOC121271072 isoform X4 [Carcharodon carcharias]|uniref:uncharacterized protein LOC121271072 isoform X4 n=1 Tax=Carcharodon carcharias TaxID=13397 RepID=UPI001B7E3AE5|nr:uncharacterized protein LOC121271072 isoform X4 [Carcharodon carcharias]